MNQSNSCDPRSNRFSSVLLESCWETADDRHRLQEVEKISEANLKSRDSLTCNDSDTVPVNVETLRSALQSIPDDVDYETRTLLAAAVQDGAPDNQMAESLLEQWSSEEWKGAYAPILDDTADEEVAVTTLFAIAERNGWDRAEEDSETMGNTSDNFTLTDFEAILNSLGSDPSQQDVERQALDLVEEASAFSDKELEKALIILEDHGARAKKRRGWKSMVTKAKKARERRQAEAGESTRGPSDYKAGEITAWLEEKMSETNHFAIDEGENLFYYDNGRYHDGGKKYVDKYVKRTLREEGLEENNTEYRRREVRESIKVDAPYLWRKPPENRICLQNGILDLETGKITPHSPEEWLMNRSISIRHDAEAEGTAWGDFLESVMPDDAGAKIGFEVIAYLLSRATGRRKALFLCGGPNTGKSTLIDNIVNGIFGEQNTRHIALQKLEDCSFARADLFGRRLNVCADLPAKPLEGASAFKQITGGDRMYAERKHEQGFDFTPHCHLVFSGNGPIIAPEAGEAFWDRWIVIPFTNNFFKGTSDHVPKEELDAKLQDPEELSALLNEVLPILRKGRGVTQTPSMEGTLNWMRRVNEEDNPSPDLPAYAGDGAVQEGGEPHLE
jgi:P4 family phage/plasmid primase-like protien